MPAGINAFLCIWVSGKVTFTLLPRSDEEQYLLITACLSAEVCFPTTRTTLWVSVYFCTCSSIVICATFKVIFTCICSRLCAMYRNISSIQRRGHSEILCLPLVLYSIYAREHKYLDVNPVLLSLPLWYFAPPLELFLCEPSNVCVNPRTDQVQSL